MQFTDHNRNYRMVRIGELDCDSMALELVAVLEQKTVAKIVYSGVARDFTISVYEEDLPLDVIERLIAAAKFALLPSTKVHGL